VPQAKTVPQAGAVAPPAASDPGRRRWLILAVIGIAQLMVVLDATIVNIALPSAQRALGFSVTDRQWGSGSPRCAPGWPSCPSSSGSW
jgi:hypothetical protein